MKTRRQFLGTGACALGAEIAARRGWASVGGQGKRMLVLGGTGFLGPALVSRAVTAGYTVTLFNRGITNPQLFPALEKIRGNRSPDLAKEDLSGLKGRTWDTVVDVWPQDPAIVESAARLLGPGAGHYLYVSSISAYDGYPVPGMDETARLRTWTPATRDYEHDKAGSEERLRALLNDKLTVIRPGPIMGERGGSPDVFTWLMRARSGGRHIAPGDGTDGVEFVDVKDVGGFLVMAARQHRFGAYNLTGRSITYRTFLERCAEVTGSAAEFVWMPQFFLEREGLKTDWELQVYSGNFPLWRPEPQLKNIFRISSQKAFDAGWQTRPFAATAQDILATFGARQEAPANWSDYLPPAREQQVLADWSRSNEG